MIQHVEGFQPEGGGQTLVDREDTGDLSVELIVCGTAERVSADISIRSISGARRWCNGCGAPSCDLREGGGIEIAAIRLPSSLVDFLVKIDRNTGDEVWPIISHVGEGVVRP